MRVLLLTQWFDPEPTFKGLVFASALVEQGFEVEVVTGFPNYPGGKLYPGYKLKWMQRERIEGVDVTRVPVYPSHDQSAIRRIFNYLSFAFCSFCYLLFGARRPAVIYAYHPPLTVGIVAALIRLLRRVPVVYDVQDMWPDTLRATGMVSSARVLSIVSAACNWVYRRVDQIVVLSPGFKRLLMARGVASQKIDVIYNWCSEDALRTAAGSLPDQFPHDSTFRILFAGNMGKAQALTAVLEAAAILLRDAPSIRFVFIGGGVEFERLKVASAAQGLSNVVILPAVPMAQVGIILRAADALLVHLRNDPLFEITIPSKTQAYMAMGKPILMGVSGDAAELIRRSGCGVIAEPENATSIAAAARELADASTERRAEMALAGLHFYQEHLSLSVGAARFGHIFREVARDPLR